MKTYELMLVIHPNEEILDETKAMSLVQAVLPVEVSVSHCTLMGKKQLAYPIRKCSQGTYIVAHLEADTIRVGDIEKKTRAHETVLRYLLTVKE